MPVRLLERAAQELVDACAHYAGEGPKLVAKLEHDVDRAIAHLIEFPHTGKPLDSVYRATKLRRFPYCLIYRVSDGEIVIVALAHMARKLDYWRAPSRGGSD